MGRTLWGGRFTKATDPFVERFTSSIGIDARLARYDVIGSIAHARMLGRCRIVPSGDSQRIVAGLKRLLRQIDRGTFVIDPSVEDIHTLIQQRLERSIGRVARTLHTARSRNDQISLDLRLYCREAVEHAGRLIRELQKALVAFAASNHRIIIPGYTHLQRAQPVLLAHHLLAYVEMLERDAERLADGRKRIDVLPLGAGALAGTSLPIDRRYVAKLLGFPRIADNSMDAVSDRDFAVELVCVLASVAVHLSRLAEDLVLWSTAEFGLLAIDDAFATGSSLMPQKKNPDVLELIRGQAGLVIGQLGGFLTMLKGLPLAYNRDLQWDKRCVFDTVEATVGALTVLARFMRHVKIRKGAPARLLDDDALYATDLAEVLVERGVPFREAHEAIGKLVAASERLKMRLGDLPAAEWTRYAPQLKARDRALINPQRSVERKRSLGGTSPRQVNQAIARWQRRLHTS